MIQTFDGMFAKSSSASRQAAIRALMNTRMTRGSVRNHCLAMMSHISRAEVMGATLEEEMKIDIILESLPDSFNQFKMNCNMNKLNLTPTQLMQELESAEKSLVKPASVHFIWEEKFWSDPSSLFLRGIIKKTRICTGWIPP